MPFEQEMWILMQTAFEVKDQGPPKNKIWASKDFGFSLKEQESCSESMQSIIFKPWLFSETAVPITASMAHCSRAKLQQTLPEYFKKDRFSHLGGLGNIRME